MFGLLAGFCFVGDGVDGWRYFLSPLGSIGSRAWSVVGWPIE